ncbi:MAG: sugar phosphate isomerase/epimerase [Pedosphaera sp.]|nr:sugar phosphate isomerase/epimerase [Pedosphaera sp.]
MKLRSFILTLAGVLAFSSTMLGAEYAPKVGLQTWTCRNMSFSQMVDFATKHGLKHVQVTGNHISPDAPREEILQKKAALAKFGIRVYTFGVAGTTPDKEKNRKLFEFAKLLECKLIIVEPTNDKALWDGLEELVKEYNIKLAIHNHGKESVYGTPEKIWSVIKNRDKRIGVCMDVGHLTGAGFDAAKAFVDYDGRVYDIHLKDKKIEKTDDGKSVILDVMVGTGGANYKGLFAELKKAKWDGVLAIETDNGTYAKEPAAFVLGAIEYVKKNN